MTQHLTSVRETMVHSGRQHILCMVFGGVTIFCLMLAFTTDIYSMPTFSQTPFQRLTRPWNYRVATFTVDRTGHKQNENETVLDLEELPVQSYLPCRKQFPDCIIVGVMKCGTQALTNFLSIHPDIAMKQDESTVMFFNQMYEKGNDWYREQMPCSKPGQVIIEKTPQYFNHPKVPERIALLDEGMKILIIVRDPVERSISHFEQVKSANPHKIRGNGTFESEVMDEDGLIIAGCSLVRNSVYVTPVKRWLNYFPRENIHFVDGDAFARDIVPEYRKIETFLGLPRSVRSDVFVFVEEIGFYCVKDQNGAICLEDGKGREHPHVDPNVLRKLKLYFQPYNEEFFQLTGQRFDWND